MLRQILTNFIDKITLNNYKNNFFVFISIFHNKNKTRCLRINLFPLKLITNSITRDHKHFYLKFVHYRTRFVYFRQLDRLLLYRHTSDVYARMRTSVV